MSKEQLLKLIRGGKAEEVKQFLLDNPTFNVTEVVREGDGWTYLHSACAVGHHEIVSALVAHPDINVNLKNSEGFTPFLVGCWGGYVEVVKVLLKDSCGLDINMMAALHCGVHLAMDMFWCFNG
jgi:hypothetical protein